jgi:CheY-like chemotaxis protein
MNLVRNAMEAMPSGGKMRISTQHRYVDRPIGDYEEIAEGDYVVLTVADAGEGIPPGDLPRIYEPFFTKKKMGRSGSGLGMAVVWGAVQDHRGYIDVESALGAGTTFNIYLPMTSQDPAEQTKARALAEHMGRGETILVVDDVEDQREIASRILSMLGYAVETVASGEEAAEHLRDHTVDLLILDMIMDPGIDGLEAYRRILARHPRQRAIVVSGFSETERVRELQRLGAGAFVLKPYTLEKIGAAVKAALERGAPPESSFTSRDR